jgi:hypothetical protein
MAQEDGRSGRFEDCSSEVIGVSIEVHRVLGPGLLESAYEVSDVASVASRSIYPTFQTFRLPLILLRRAANSVESGPGPNG